MLNTERKRQLNNLVYLTIFGLILILFRAVIPNPKSLHFLLWNLILAIIPLLLSSFIVKRYKQIGVNFKLFLIGFFWLVFFPNAPYILTDYLHVFNGNAKYFFVDVFIWMYFAGLAIWIALLSLRDIESILVDLNIHWVLILFFMLLVCFVSGYGIYLGRDLRLNSWDIIGKPGYLLNNVYLTFTNRSPGFFNWEAVVFYSTVLYLLYLASFILRRIGLK